MPPLIGFIIGVLSSELSQWGIWITAHPGRPRVGYWQDGLGHLLLAWSTCGIVAALWASNGLDYLVGFLPDAISSQWADTGIPFTPQVGLLLGYGIDFMGDKLAFAIRVRLGGTMSAGQIQAAQVATPQAVPQLSPDPNIPPAWGGE